MRHFLLFLFCWLFSSPSQGQTCVIIVKTNNYIFAGADSRRPIDFVAFEKGAQRTHIKYDSVCKIRHAGNIYFSNLGYFSEEGYYLAIQSCNGDNLVTIVRNYTKKRKEQLYKLLQKEKDLGIYEKDYTSNYMRLFSTIFYTIEKKTTKVIISEIKIISEVNEPVKLKEFIQYDTIPDPTDMPHTMYFGHSEEAKLIIDTDKLPKNIFFGDGLKYVIEKQAEKTPQTVGKPVEVFLMSTTGNRWVYNPLKCD
jgi:hypothetical protein